jgi:hypothetical protein
VVDRTHYWLHLFDAHGRGRQNPAPLTIDAVLGQVLEFYSAPSPPLELNAVVSGRVSGACARVTRLLGTTACVVESIPRVAGGLAFAQNSSGTPGVGEAIDLDNCQGTGSGYLVNNVGGYGIGATAIAVDTGVGTMLVGDRVKFAGHETLYTVATALTAGTVVISPGLTATIANNEVVTLRGGEAFLLPLGTSQTYPAGNQYVVEHHDDELSETVNPGIGQWPWWDRNAKTCETIAISPGWTGTFRKGDECGTSAGGRFTIQLVSDLGAGVLGLAITRKRGTVAAANTITNLTIAGGGTIAAMAFLGATPQGMFVPYSPIPNLGGPALDDFYFERIPNGNGTTGGEASLGPDARMMHMLADHHAAATSVGDRGWRVIPFSSWDDEGVVDGNLGGVTIQVVKCTGTFPLSGTLVIGQTVTGPGGWSGTVHGWNNTLKYLFVRATNGATLTTGTLTLSGGATVSGVGAAYGWAKGSTHWNNMAAQITAATTAAGALSGGAAIKWDGIIAQPWETEINLHSTTVGCPYPTLGHVQQGWLAFATDLRTLLGDTTIPITTWEHRNESHETDVFIVPGFSFASYHNSLIETLPVAVPRLTVVRSHGYQMSNDSPNLWLRTEDYVDLGEQFFRHLMFGQISVAPGDGLEEVAIGVTVGQSQKTGYIPIASMTFVDRDPDLWPSSTFPGVSTVDQNLLVWNPLTMQIEVCDIAVNGGNGSWGTSAGTCGPEVPVNQRMKRRFSEDPVQSTRFLSFKYTVPGSCLNSAIPFASGCWDPSLTTRPATVASCTVSALAAGGPSVPARGRFTAAAGTFSGPEWIVGKAVTVAGSLLGAQGIGGNNSPQWTVQRVFAVASNGSYIEVEGAFVVETASFTLTAGPPPIWPDFQRQFVAMQRDCQRLGLIPRVVYIDFEQGESDLELVSQYEESLRRVWTGLVSLCAKRLRGDRQVAKCITLVHSQTPMSPGDDAPITAIRQIQTDVAADLGNCAVVDPSDLPLEINGAGTWPRTEREHNGAHHTARAMIVKGFRVDRALGTLEGIPAHPAGELAVDFGAVDGGTGGSSTDGGSDSVDDSADSDTGGSGGTDGVLEPTAQQQIDLGVAIYDSPDVASYTTPSGLQVTRRSIEDMLRLERAQRHAAARSSGIRRTLARFEE